MKKITAIILAVVVFAAGFGAGNIYRSICKAAESKSGTTAENGTENDEKTDADMASSNEIETVTVESESDREETEVWDQTDKNFCSYEMTETESETVAVGLESTLLSEKVRKNSTGTQLTDFEIIEQYPELPTGCEITAMTMVLNYYGYNVDKVTMALDYMPKVQADVLLYILNLIRRINYD